MVQTILRTQVEHRHRCADLSSNLRSLNLRRFAATESDTKDIILSSISIRYERGKICIVRTLNEDSRVKEKN